MRIQISNPIDFDKYVTDNKLLDKKEFYKRHVPFSYKDARKMINKAKEIYNLLLKRKKYLKFIDFNFSDIMPKYAYIIHNSFHFNKLFNKIKYNLDSEPSEYDTFLYCRTVYKTGSIKLLKKAIVESFCCSLPIQCLLLLGGNEDCLSTPISFFEPIRLKKEYQNFEGIITIFNRLGFRVALEIPKRWDNNLIYNVFILEKD